MPMIDSSACERTSELPWFSSLAHAGKGRVAGFQLYGAAGDEPINPEWFRYGRPRWFQYGRPVCKEVSVWPASVVSVWPATSQVVGDVPLAPVALFLLCRFPSCPCWPLWGLRVAASDDLIASEPTPQPPVVPAWAAPLFPPRPWSFSSPLPLACLRSSSRSWRVPVAALAEPPGVLFL